MKVLLNDDIQNHPQHKTWFKRFRDDDWEGVNLSPPLFKSNTKTYMAFIKVHNRVAMIIKNMGVAWRIKFLDTSEVIAVFYHGEEQWDIFIPSNRYYA